MNAADRPMRALIVGASRGIGAATARALAQAGHAVALVARGAQDLERVAAEVGGHAIRADASQAEEVRRAVQEAESSWGAPAEVLVSCSGTFSVASIVDADPEDFQRAFDANVKGTLYFIQAVLPGMLRRGDGLIVNVGSVAGRRAFPGNAAYSTSKYGLRGLHEVLLEELRGTGVRATLVEPAAVDTPLWDPLDPDARDDLPDRVHMMRPEDVARLVRFVVAQPATVQLPLVQIERA